MPIAAEDLLRLQLDRAQCLLDQAASLAARGCEAKPAHRRREHMVDPVERVVDAVRVLENRLNVAPERPSCVTTQAAEIRAAIAYRPDARLDQAKQQASQGRLA